MLDRLNSSSFVRTSLLLVLVLAIQTSLLAEVRPFGGVIDLVAMFAVLAGVVAGPMRGGRAGLLFGICFDLQIATTFGIKALAYGLVAMAIGAVAIEPVRTMRTLIPLVTAGGTALAVMVEALIAGIFGRGEALSRDLLAAMATSAAVAFLSAPFFVKAVRWAMLVAERPRL
jgi:rod shape-determining protein MreD